MHPRTMLAHLRELYAKSSRTERYELAKNLFRARMPEGSSVEAHVLKMIGLIERMASLGFTFTPGLDIDLILQSLPKSFSSFVMQYNMGKYENTRSELLNMLKEAEGNILSDKSQVLLVGETSKKKRKPN